MEKPLTFAMKKAYADYMASSLDESNFQDCVAWNGPFRTLLDGTKMGMIVEGMEVYFAAAVGYALFQKTDYPLRWFSMSCGNKWCVAGDHVVFKPIHEQRGPGRPVVSSLKETAGYKAKAEFIKKYLADRPNALTTEIIPALREEGFGGNQNTLLRIIASVRQELGLKSRGSNAWTNGKAKKAERLLEKNPNISISDIQKAFGGEYGEIEAWREDLLQRLSSSSSR